jgi:hypothetical protein
LRQCQPHGCEGTSFIPAREGPPLRHVLGDAGLADLDAEQEKLSMDSRRSPQRVGEAHLADQPANFVTVQLVGRSGAAISNANTI